MLSVRLATADVATYFRALQPLIDLWSLVTQHATHEITNMPTRRMMGAHVEHLQSLYQGALLLPVPTQCSQAHSAFLKLIRSTIAAYLATAEQIGDDQAHVMFLSAMSAFAEWRTEVASLGVLPKHPGNDTVAMTA